MKTNYFKIIAFFLVFLLLNGLFAASSDLNIDDFNLSSAWQRGIELNDFSVYENALIEQIEKIDTIKKNANKSKKTTISDESIEGANNVLTAEALFYKYFAPKTTSDVTASKVEEFLANQLKNLNQYKVCAFNYFKFMASTKLFVSNSLGKELLSTNLDLEAFSKTKDNSVSTNLPNGSEMRLSLLRAIAEVEAQNTRFLNAKDLNSDLRFSDEAFIKMSQNPSLVFVLKNEPSFSALYDSYLITKQNISSMSFGTFANAYYSLENNLLLVRQNISKYSILTSEVLSSFSNNVLNLYFAEPFILTQLTTEQINFVSKDIQFIKNVNLFANRFNDLIKITK